MRIKTYRLFFTLGLLMIIGNVLQAQNNDPFPKWKQFTNGKEVLAVEKEGKYVWIGTDGGGLIKRNTTTGKNTFYHSANSKLPGNEVKCIAIDDSGTKWIGTKANGLAKFDGKNWTLYTPDNSVVGEWVETIALDSANNVWIGHAEQAGGLIKYDGKNWTKYLMANSQLPDNWMLSIAIDSANHKWIGTANGLVQIKDSTNWKIYNKSNSQLPGNFVQAVAVDTANQKWLGTQSEGVMKYDNGNWNDYKDFNSGLEGNNITHIQIGPNAKKWFCTRNNGYASFDGSNWNAWDANNSPLPGMFIRDIAIGKSGAHWVGVNKEGLTKYDGTNNWNTHDLANSPLPNPMTRAIAIDQNGKKWIGNKEGLLTYDGSNWTIYDGSSFGLNDLWVIEIFIDDAGNKWIGTIDQGVIKYDGTNYKRYDNLNSPLPWNMVRSITQDTTGKMWFGTLRGLASFDGTNWNVFNANSTGLPGNDIRTLAVDSANNVWAGTWLDGMGMFDGQTWTSFKESRSPLPDDDVYSIHIDEDNNKWIGSGGYLMKYRDSNWDVQVNLQKQLNTYFIYGIHFDSNGTKWLNTSTGLFKVKGCSLHKYDWFNSGEPGDNLEDMAIDEFGNKWMCSNSGVTLFMDSAQCPSTKDTLQVTADSSYVSPSCKDTFTQSGIYNDTTFNKAGCPKLVTIDLNIQSKDSFERSYDTVTACDSYQWPVNGITYQKSGNYTDTLPKSQGKDSLFHLNLILNQPSRDSIQKNACKKFTVPSEDETYKKSGTYNDTIPNNAECDSIITFDLTIHKPDHDTISPTACQEYTSPSDSNTWYQSGKYHDTLQDDFGCDSILTIRLTIPTIDTGVSQNGSTLKAKADSATYQWLDCNNNYQKLKGETSSTFNPESDGNYAVEITQNGCADTSQCYQINSTSLKNDDLENAIIYPNPTNKTINVQLGQSHQNFNVKIRNLSGQIIQEKHFGSASEFKITIEGKAGYYWINLNSSDGEITTFQIFKRK